MHICTCSHCKYTFRYPMIPFHCPDCGKDAVREATEEEIRDYHQMQAILREEIRLGLYAATG